MLNKKEREKVLALYFNAVKNYTIECLQNFAGKKTSEYWNGGEVLADKIIKHRR